MMIENIALIPAFVCWQVSNRLQSLIKTVYHRLKSRKSFMFTTRKKITKSITKHGYEIITH